LIKGDWLDACVALRVVGAVLVVFLRRWRKIGTLLQPMGSKNRYLQKSIKPCLTIVRKESWIKYTPLTLLSQGHLPREIYTFCVIKPLEPLQNLKISHVPYLGQELTMHVLISQIYLVRQFP
jgi:hypothetical protein